MRNNLNKRCTKKSKHILFSISSFFRKSCRLWDNVEKYCTAGQATDDNCCVLEYHTSKSVVTVQRAFRTKYGGGGGDFSVFL